MWLIKPTKVDLKEFVAKPRFDQAALDLTFTKHLVAIDGVQPDIAENVREVGYEGNLLGDEQESQEIENRDCLEMQDEGETSKSKDLVAESQVIKVQSE